MCISSINYSSVHAQYIAIKIATVRLLRLTTKRNTEQLCS